MTVADYPSLGEAGRAVKRAVVGRWRGKPRVPQLRVGERRGGEPPTVWMICPDWDHPAGGIRKQYRAVDVLNGGGIPAAIVHERPGFECTWFEHSTRIAASGEVMVARGDVIVVPEIYGPAILDLPAGVPQIIWNQNAYVTLDSLVASGPAASAPYVENPDLAAVVVVSDDSAEVLSYAFPGTPIRRIHHGIDSALHHPAAMPAGKRISYMPRRRADDAAQVLALLESRGALAGWEVVRIEHCSEAEVADLMRSSAIFLSFSEREGFGLPPCEALACGCLVVGYDGFAGREFFRPPFAEPVEDGDVVAFARAVERVMRRVEEQPAEAAAASRAGAQFIMDRYSPEVERKDLIETFAPLFQP
ncbi:MAG TPA: glycosyltransferase [Thermoleophilaceae bacterium]|jgi:glycosyltransferase involved in cell wall biosynthesis